MKNKKLKVCSLIIMTAVCSTLSGVPHKTEAALTKNGIVYVTKSDVKNGKVVIKDKKVKSIVVKSEVKKATIELNNVKLSDGLSFEKGSFVLKTKKANVKSLKIGGKNTKIKLDKASDLNNKKLTLIIAKNTTGNLDLASFGKNLNVNLGKNTDFKLAIGKKESAKIIVKKAYESSVLEIAGKGEGSKVSKITVECPVALVVNVRTGLLETKKSAEKGSVTLLSSVDEVKNKGNVEIKDTLPLEDSAKNEDKKEESVKNNKTEENKKTEDNSKANLGGSGASNGGGGGASGGGGSLGGGSNGSSGGGSSSTQKPATGIEFVTTDFNIKENTGEITVQVKYLPEGSIGKIEWDIKGKVGGKTNTPNVAGIVSSTDKGTIESIKSGETIKIRALNNGTYKVSAKLEGKPATYISKEGQVEGQKVKLAAGTPANYKAGDGKITGVEVGNQYILISDNKYYGVAANGVASSGYTERELALNQTANLTVTDITGLDNSKTYTVEKIDVAKEAEKRLLAEYEAYMKDSEYEPGNITFNKYRKYEELVGKGDKLLKELEKKVDSAESDKAVWEKRVIEARKRSSEVNRKINENKKAIEDVREKIREEFKNIQKLNQLEESNKLEGEIIKSAVENIDSENKKVDGVPINEFLKDEEITLYNEVKKEINLYSLLNCGTSVLKFDIATKVLTLPKQKVDVMYEVRKDMQENEWKVMGTGVISAGTEKFPMKTLLDSYGKGSYEIRVFKNFNYIKNKFIDTNIGLKVDIN